MKKFNFFIFLIILISLFAIKLHAQPENREAKITYFRGQVEVQKKGTTAWEAAKIRTALKTGDMIKTGQNSQVDLRLDDGSVLKIEQNTTFEIQELSQNNQTKDTKSQFKLWIGDVWGKVQKLTTTQSSFEINTPTATAAVRGTIIRIKVKRSGESQIEVTEGCLEIIGNQGDKLLICNGQEIIVDKNGNLGEAKENPQKEGEQTPPPLKEIQHLINPGTMGADVEVSGKTEPTATVIIDGEQTLINEDGYFSKTIFKPDGMHLIVITATDTAGNTTLNEKELFINTIFPTIEWQSQELGRPVQTPNYNISCSVFDDTPGDQIRIILKRIVDGNEEILREKNNIQSGMAVDETILLVEGENTIVAEVFDMEGNPGENSRNIILDSQAPLLILIQPTSDMILPRPPNPPGSPNVFYYSVSGRIIDPEPSSGIDALTVNGMPWNIQNEGNGNYSFENEVPLNRGVNTLTFTVKDVAGNGGQETSVTRIITVE